MPYRELNEEQKNKIKNFLNAYASNQKLMTMGSHEQKYFSDDEPNNEYMPHEEPLAKARMYEVRHFILGLSNGDGKLFLYHHYVKLHTVEQCAELLGISVRSAYRLKNKALAEAYGARFGEGVSF